MFLSASLRVTETTLRDITEEKLLLQQIVGGNYSGVLMLIAILPLNRLIFLCVRSFST